MNEVINNEHIDKVSNLDDLQNKIADSFSEAFEKVLKSCFEQLGYSEEWVVENRTRITFTDEVLSDETIVYKYYLDGSWIFTITVYDYVTRDGNVVKRFRSEIPIK